MSTLEMHMFWCVHFFRRLPSLVTFSGEVTKSAYPVVHCETVEAFHKFYRRPNWVVLTLSINEAVVHFVVG